MDGQKGLRDIYHFAKYLGLIDKIPNLKDAHKNIVHFTGIQNAVYDILKLPGGNNEKALLLRNMNIFTKKQVEYILNNQADIIEPYDRVIQNRQNRKRHLNIQLGGAGSLLDIVPSLETGLKIPTYQDLVATVKAKLAELKSPLKSEVVQNMLAKFGITPEVFNLIINMRPSDLKDIIGTFGFKMPDTPEIKLTDWVFFPLWSIENLPIVGPVAGIPIDFMSVMIAQLDIILNGLVDTLDNFREPAIQAASSAFGVATVGVGLAATPIIVPIINRFFDLVVHLVAHFGSILNMFINISRKNFGLAYVLFCEIVPIFETFMNIVINYMVILNRFLNRSGRFLDLYIDFLTNLERVIYMSHPKHLLKIKDEIIEKIQNRIAEKMSAVSLPGINQ